MQLVSVDVGGTFTDIVSVEDGVIHTTKVPTDLVDSARGVLKGADEVGVRDALVFNHASTAGLNALLTRNLPKVGLITTIGQRDILDIGSNIRPHEAIADPRWRRSFGDANRPLVPRYLRRTVPERMKADGSVFLPLDEDAARREIRVLGRCNVEGVAIGLLNAWTNGVHEQRLAELVREELGDIPVVMSHAVSPVAPEYPRISTTVIDAMMKVIYGDYSGRLQNGLSERGFTGSLNFGDCAAMLAPVETAMDRPSRVVFSGPAAGTTASAHFGRLIGRGNLICVDVGGTSTDVSIVLDGQPIINTSLELEPDMVVTTLSNEIASVGAGGGSLITVGPGGEIQVGPGSAGADPGPACYGRGGVQPTMTDAAVLMGILSPENFLGGKATLDYAAAVRAFESLDTPLSFEQRVQDAFRIGLHNIAEGIVDIVIRNGVDPREFSLVIFGAGGPMLIPSLLDMVKVREAVIPPHPGLFSAIGLLSSDMVFMESQSLMIPLDESAVYAIDAVFEKLEQKVRDEIGSNSSVAKFVRTFDARMAGQAFETAFIDAPDGDIGTRQIEEMVAKFHAVYEQRAGNKFESMPVEAVTFRVQAVVEMPKAEFGAVPRRTEGTPQPIGDLELKYLRDGEKRTGNRFERDDLLDGDVIHGPAVVHERLSTTFVPAGFVLQVGSLGEFVIELEAKK
ncbi:hydantoinase/oxoprolinase family protein [Sinomonas humi]|uniref:5-oxoprolinase n=1 Tax=Sinomonas humi TaxID=1338436 RepID=A0A0B2AG14_9MICC|nr:hydantoinase/oxoprolinase family protein [Sinomonas humi]KHL02474.1 5-oxoprolinase [Sinomonas humi]